MLSAVQKYMNCSYEGVADWCDRVQNGFYIAWQALCSNETHIGCHQDVKHSNFAGCIVLD